SGNLSLLQLGRAPAKNRRPFPILGTTYRTSMLCNSHTPKVLRTPIFHTSATPTISSTSTLLEKQGGIPPKSPETELPPCRRAAVATGGRVCGEKHNGEAG